MELVLKKTFLQKLNDPLFEEKKLNIFVLRDDLIHPFISGNKWRKLKYNLDDFLRQGYESLLTFGGAYSNHIVATAAAGKEFGIKTIGIIRGEEHTEQSNPVLHFASACGMKLIFVSREKYKNLRTDNSQIISELRIPGSKLFILPEGGSNESAMKGCKEIVDDIPVDFDYICCACGTGTTLAGIVTGLKSHQQAIGMAVLKGAGFIEKEVEKYAGSNTNCKVVHDYHFGGYAKSSGELESFCRSFERVNKIPVEPVYTGKLFFGLDDLAQKYFFEEGKTIIAVHTGGIYNFLC